jgi:2-oxo-4-hydroxy-4-carboxy--5-ureidoimidazoline (OHCU) decarboxylase
MNDHDKIPRAKSNLLVNKAHVRTYALDFAAQTKPHERFTRVADDLYVYLDNAVKEAIERVIRRHPSTGRTISSGIKAGGE